MFGGYYNVARLTASGNIVGSAKRLVVFKVKLVAGSGAVAPLEAHLRPTSGGTDDDHLILDAKNKSTSELYPEGIRYNADGYVTIDGTGLEVYVYYRLLD